MSQTTTASARTVLLIEDDDDIRESLTDVLRAEGWRVSACIDAPTALARFAGMPPDEWPAVVLVDLMMPEMSGEEFLTRLRAQVARAAPGHALPRLILLTAAAVDREAAQSLGADQMVKKPFDIEDLLSAMTGKR